MAIKKQKTSGIRVVSAEPISPHAMALYEAGKIILIDSLETGREFCKLMIRSSTGAIPIYLGVLTFILPTEYRLGSGAGWLIALPAIGFLVASLLFIAGYLPLVGEIYLCDVDGINRERNRIIMHRIGFIWAGSSVFTVSVLGAVWTIIRNIGVR